MKVLLVTPSMEVGGNERIVIALARGLAAGGHALTVFGPTGALEPELSGVELERVMLAERGRTRLGALWAALRLAALVARRRPDVVHAINPKMTAVAAAAIRLTSLKRPPLVATFGACAPADVPAAVRILCRCDAVCAVSHELGADLTAAGLPPSLVRIIPPGVSRAHGLAAGARSSLEAELNLGTAPVVLAIGRLVPEKNHLRLLEAAALVTRRHPDAQFLVAGDGPLRSALRARAAELGLDGRVTFLGDRRDVPSLVQRAELVAFSSDQEGLSVAALEALASGTPVVTTPAAGMHELLGEGAGSVMSDFAAATLSVGILELLADEPRRREMGRRGVALVASRYSVEVMVEAYAGLYRELARAARRRGPASSSHSA